MTMTDHPTPSLTPTTVLSLQSTPGRQHGHHILTDPYAETFWLPCIGPSSLLLARRVVAWTLDGPVDVPAIDLACTVGLNLTRFSLTVKRLAQFGLGDLIDATLTVHSLWPELTVRQEQRLPPMLLDAHRSFLIEQRMP